MESTEVHRSPLTYEIVEPTKGVDKRVEGRKNHSNCGSPQLFENNDLKSEPVTEAAATSPDRLHNSETLPPNFAIIREKPEHRFIVYLKAQGLSNKEVADKTGYTQSWLSQLIRQPWFRLRLTQELKEAGVDAVQNVIRASALDSVFTLIDLRDDPTAPKAVKKAAADSLLDRYLGKPTQKFENENPRLPSSPEITALNKEIDSIEHQLKETNGTQTET